MKQNHFHKKFIIKYYPILMDKDKIKVLIEKNNIRWIQIHFTDLLGKLRVLHIPSEGFLNDAFKDGISFDGSSVGFTNVE
ncbi:MAG TPA: hypothetical protein ENI33_00880, partial [Thermoplasmatales archaeon]|nr:hypothetical protein [Thermoplasmatales archaeon]